MNKLTVLILVLVFVASLIVCTACSYAHGYNFGAIDVTTHKVQCYVVNDEWRTGNWQCFKVQKVTIQRAVSI